MDASELIRRAREATEAATERVWVPEWDTEVTIRAVEARQLAALEADELKSQQNPELLTTAAAQWLAAGMVEPHLSLAEASELLQTQAAPVNRLLMLIRLKSQVGMGAEEWALATLSLASPELRVLADFYRAQRERGADVLNRLEEALQRARDGGIATAAQFAEFLASSLAEGWSQGVDEEKKVS